MKIIHCADIHLDSKMETNLSSQQAKERKNEILNTFEKMISFAANNDVQGIIIAGDMFDTTRITNSTKSRVLNLISKYPNIDFFYLSGNHDETNFISLIEDVPSNLKIFGNDWTTFEYGKVKITGVVLNENNTGINYDALSLGYNDLNILVMHGQTGKYETKGKSDIINLSKLKNKNIDYLALGHIHSFEKTQLDERGIMCYAGCLEGRGFDECGEKGFVLLTIEDIINTEFVPFAKRQLIECKFDITGFDNWFDIEEKVLELVKNIGKQNLLKLVLTGKYNIKLDKHLSMLKEKLDSFYFVKVKDESILEVSLEDVERDLSLRGEFIRKVLSSDLSKEDKDMTILVGLKALGEEDL